MKAVLQEVMVVGKNLSNTLFAAGIHGDAVGETIAFIGTLAIKKSSVQEGFSGLRLDGHRVIREYIVHGLDRLPAKVAACPRKSCKEFRQDFVSREQVNIAENSECLQRTRMPGVIGERYGDPIEGVCENAPHFLGNP